GTGDGSLPAGCPQGLPHPRPVLLRRIPAAGPDLSGNGGGPRVRLPDRRGRRPDLSDRGILASPDRSYPESEIGELFVGKLFNESLLGHRRQGESCDSVTPPAK